MADKFIRACNIYISREGDEVLIAALLNHNGLWAEILDGVVSGLLVEPTRLGELMKAQLSRCELEASFSYRDDRKKTDWPAFVASGARSVSAFEKSFVRYRVGGTNEANIILNISSERVNDEFTLRDSINAYADPQELGDWLLRMHRNYLGVESLFQ